MPIIMRNTAASSGGGYIALISAIIITLVLTTLTFAVSAKGYAARSNAANAEYKRMSLALAQSCADAALLAIAKNYTYLPPSEGETVHVGEATCVIMSVDYGAESAAGQRSAQIRSQATTNGAWSTLRIDATITNPASAIVPHPDITITKWEEIR